MRQRPRGDSRGILDSARLLREVRFRRYLPAQPLRRWVEHYWLIDWSVRTPFEQRVVPHPAVNVVFQQDGDSQDRDSQNGDSHNRDSHNRDSHGPESGEVAGVGRELFRITLTGTGRVCGVQFRPGGFHPFWRRSVAELTGQRRPLPVGRLTSPDGPVCAGTDDDRRRALDTLLTGWAPEPDPLSEEAIRLAEAIRTDRTVLRVDDFAARHDVPVRRLQRLFVEYVGVGPKWVIRRYRLQEAVERAAGGPLSWADIAADLGYSDQAHLVRDFTAVAGVSPAAYARSVR
ncbi:AraC family transcriptional regulator [Micromonospora sp. WMMD1120]|uniref:helix-turn-helix domain-containing protein n=1 Tax=Micromonospora sp. WMMD1120 TaxID=3016106 RepID=UPI002416F4A0|nr:AraC family transcriptional regulator [Micromonospora sp. WMMD1120]MDG4807251.1 AraC family transcriptional regulator [Micromonospora sp. WMMD1120]